MKSARRFAALTLAATLSFTVVSMSAPAQAKDTTWGTVVGNR